MSEEKKLSPRSEKDGILNFGKEMGSALATALVFIIYIIQAFVIPTGSMEKSLLVGDFLLGLKFMYGAPVVPGIPKIVDTYWKFPAVTDPKRGDVVIFKYPGKGGQNYIKRCIAVAGDTVQVVGKLLVVNGVEQIPPPNAQWIRGGELAPGITNFAPIYVPKKGDTLNIASADLRGFIFYKHLIHQENPYKTMTETFGLTINGVDYTDSTLVLTGIDPENKLVQYLGLANGAPIKFRELAPQFKQLSDMGDWSQYAFYLDLWSKVFTHITGSEKIAFPTKLFMDGKEVTTYITKWESYFMMGDNRDNSADSRYWGFVNRNFVKAKAAIIYFSLDKEVPFYMLPAKIRWNRLGKLIRNWDGMTNGKKYVPSPIVDSTVTVSQVVDSTSSAVIDTTATVDSIQK